MKNCVELCNCIREQGFNGNVLNTGYNINLIIYNNININNSSNIESTDAFVFVSIITWFPFQKYIKVLINLNVEILIVIM